MITCIVCLKEKPASKMNICTRCNMRYCDDCRGILPCTCMLCYPRPHRRGKEDERYLFYNNN